MSKKYQEKCDQLQAEIDALQAEFDDYRTKAEASSQQQQNTIDDQEKTIADLKLKIELLEAALAKAKKNSTNSSKPPSSDITKPPKSDNNNQENGEKQARKRGAQEGHEANFREEFPPEQVDQVFVHEIKICPECLAPLQLSDRRPMIVQQIKLVEKPFLIEEHQAFAYWCQQCQCYHYAPLPPEVYHGCLFDAKLTSLVAYMKSTCHMSYSTIRNYLRDTFGITVSRGYLKKVCAKVSDALEFPYSELLTAVPLQDVVNIDESSLPENGKKLWIWIFETKLFSLFKISPSRGSKVLVEVLGEEFDGVIGCDYFSAYRAYMRKFSVVVQFCLAHLIRDIKYLTGLSDEATKNYGELLRDKMRELFALIHSRDTYAPDVFEALLQAKKTEIIEAATNNVPETREAQNMKKRFVKHGEYYFTFITTPDIDPTNNVAEHAIRFVTIDRLITQGVRGEWGRIFLERLWSITRTCKKRGLDVLQYLEEAVLAFWNGTTPPPLLPTE